MSKNSLNQKNSELAAPQLGETAIVRCKGYFCLGYYAGNNKWKTVYGDAEILDIVKIIPLPVKPDCLSFISNK